MKPGRHEIVKIEDLFLDPENPRLSSISATPSQASLHKVLEEQFDLQPVADSMYNNGYFVEEPLVVVSEKIAEKEDPVLVVVEGNRRLAALKSIANDETKYSDKEKRDRLVEVPVIIHDSRKEVLPFLGFRHITGIKPWGSREKAKYAYDLVESGLDLKRVCLLIGDSTRGVARLIRTESLIREQDRKGYVASDAAKGFYFSYLLTASDSKSVKDYLDLKIDENKGTVASYDSTKFHRLWLWLYGSKQEEATPVITESRQISLLSKVLSDRSATKELEKTRDLVKAHKLTVPPVEHVEAELGEIRSRLQDLVTFVTGEDIAPTDDMLMDITKADRFWGDLKLRLKKNDS